MESRARPPAQGGISNLQILRLTTFGALRKAPLRQRKVAAARTAGGCPQRARLRKKQASEAQTAQAPPAIRIASLWDRLQRGLRSRLLGRLQNCPQGVALERKPWSPQPQTHRKKQQRHQLC